MSYPELRENYDLQETLGSGGFAKVKAAIHKLTGEKVAIKIMNKEQLGADLPRAYREIKALKKLHHQHICQMFQVIETKRMIFLVIEFCSGGELFDYIVAKERLKEKEARAFFRQIVSAIKYIHGQGFVHRDLKPENLLLDDDSNIKLIDFGLVSEPDVNVTQKDTSHLLETCCGSPAYAAPELIKGGPYVGPRADVWSLGVLLYALLNGFLPFDDDHTPRLYQLIQEGEYEIPEWLTPASVGMIATLLQTDPRERITIDGLLKDSWIKKGYGKCVDWKSRSEVDVLDRECVAEMARYYHKTEEKMMETINKWEYDDMTATYFLLLQKKQRGYTPTIIVKSIVHESHFQRMPSTPQSPLIKSVYFPNGNATPEFPLVGMENPSGGNRAQESPVIPPNVLNATQTEPARNRRISLGQPIHPPAGEVVTKRKEKPPLYPAISIIKDQESCFTQPSASKASDDCHTSMHLAASMPLSNALSFNLAKATPQTTVPKTRSYESRLQHAVQDESVSTYNTEIVSPRKGSRVRIGSLNTIEDLVRKAKKVFTHGKPSHSETTGPRKVKGIYDISTTSRKDSHIVLEELEQALRQFNVEFKTEGYVVKCSVPCYKESTSHKKDKVKAIRFELEVCLLPRLEMLGVRRKRIRGDVWEFKRICDQIFKATHL